MRLGVVLLAAGAGRRIGGRKPFVRHRARTLLAIAADAAGAAVDGPLIVVTGADRHAVAALAARSGARPVHNRRWRTGMGSSLSAGIAALPGAVSGVLVLTVDQYAVRASDLERLAAAWRRRPGRAAAAAYDGVVGVPAVFPGRSFGRLRRLAGDRGARRLLREAPRRVTRVPMPAAALDRDS
jgi:CTP:molybdopterin cytidylyltransferase MocA